MILSLCYSQGYSEISLLIKRLQVQCLVTLAGDDVVYISKNVTGIAAVQLLKWSRDPILPKEAVYLH